MTKLTAILDACWGTGGYSLQTDPENPTMPPLSPQQTDLLLAGMKLLNWNFPRLNSFLKEKFAIAQIEELEANQVDTLFGLLHEAIANWLTHRIEGEGSGASPGALSSAYWQERLKAYPEPAPPWVRKKRKEKWILDCYIPPAPKPEPAPAPEPDPNPDPDPPDDWRFWDYPDENYW